MFVNSEIALFPLVFFTEFRESLQAAIDQGSVEVEIVKCVTLGPPEAGKTQLKSALVGRFTTINESTPMSTGAEVVMQRYISGKSSWEPLTVEGLRNSLHKTVKRKEFIESASATSLPTAKKDASMSSPVMNEKGQPLPKGQQTVSGTNVAEAKRKEELLKQFSGIRRSVEQGLKEADSADVKGLQKVRMIHLIDCGGQPAFLDIHPVIATSRAVYLLVYNMDEGLEAKPKITYRKSSFPTKDLPNEKQSNLDMIKDSLLILQNCKQKFLKMEWELHRWFEESISQSEDAVPVLVVGTRKKVESIVSESGKLSAGCGHLPTWSEVLDCTDTGMKLFAVESMDQGCEGLQSVRDVINGAECIYHLRLPISWVLCQLIFWSAEEDLHILTYADLQDLCLQEHLVANDAEFLAMIRAFHLLGIFSFPYFDQELVLGSQWKPDSHPVFTNPDVLYHQVSKVLEVAFLHLERTKMKPEAKRSLKELQSNGRLNVGTLSHLSIPDQLGSFNGFHSYLLEQLVHWGLAARLGSKTSPGKSDGETKLEYFIPSVFPACGQETFCFPTKCPIPDLAFTFHIQNEVSFYYVPQGIFPHLVVNTLTADKGYNIQPNKDNYKCLYRDAATFVIKPSSCSTMEYSYNVRLTNKSDHILISIQPSHIAMRRCDRDCHQIIRDFQSAIEDVYKRIYHTHHPVTLACPCPCGRICKDHLAAILPRVGTPAQYIQECLSTEGPHWEQDCPKDITAIVNQGRE